MSTYYSGEDEKRKKQKEDLPPKKDTFGSTFSEENIDISNTDKNQKSDAANQRSGSGKDVKQKDLDAEEPAIIFSSL